MKGHGSIRWRIQIWQTLLLTIIVTVLGVIWYNQQKTYMVAEIDRELSGKSIGILRQFQHELYKRGPNKGNREFRKELPRHPRHQARREESGEEKFRRPRRRDHSVPRGIPRAAKRIIRSNNEVFDQDDYYLCAWNEGKVVLEKAYSGPREMPSMVVPTSGILRTVSGYREILGRGPHTDVLVIGYDLTNMYQTLGVLKWQIAGVAVGVVFVGFIIGWIATGVAVKPIYHINKVATNIAKGELSERIDLIRPTSEIASLSNVLNDTFSELERAFIHQKQFTADASHELRNPIAAMLMEVEVALACGVKDEETKESLDICKRNLNEMNNLVQGLLSLARLDDGTLSKDAKLVDLADIVKEVSDRFSHLASEQDVELVVEAQRSMCRVVPGQVIQVIDNLLSNAIKYGSDGERIELDCGFDGKKVFLKVRDYGKGIKAAHLPQVFDRFFRADEARALQQGSSGIGLAIVKAMVKANNGEVSVESKEGEGAMFVVTFPAT